MGTTKKKEHCMVLITGAGGFLGRRLVEFLLEQGYHVRILVRKQKDLKLFRLLNVDIIFGDIRKEESVRDAISGVDYIVHAAAAQSGTWEIFKETTVMGTERVFRLAIEFGVKRIIYISSMSVYQIVGLQQGTIIKENAELEKRPAARGNYTRSKVEAEIIARNYMNKVGIGPKVVILRPATIYGPGSPIFQSLVGISLLDKIFIVLGNKRMEIPLVYIDNLVDAILLSLENEGSMGHIFNVIDDDRVTKETYIKNYLKKIYPFSLCLFFPQRLISFMVFWQEFFLKKLKRKPVLTGYRFLSASHGLTFSNDLIKKKMRWDSTISLRKGLERTFSFEKNHNSQS